MTVSGLTLQRDQRLCSVDPEQPVKAGQAWKRSLSLEYGDLLSQGQDFEGGIASAPQENMDSGQDCKNEFGHGTHPCSR